MKLFESFKNWVDGKPDPEDDEDISVEEHKNYNQEDLLPPLTNPNLAVTGNSLDFKLVKPASYVDVKEIAVYLKNYHTVVLNLENADSEAARRILDFLAGVTFTIGGTLKPVAKRTYLISPPNVNVSEAIRSNSASSTNTMGLSGLSGETFYK